jgi:hypothetical protein
MNETILSSQEKKWIMEQRVTRLSDQQEALIYPMGAERYLFLVLQGKKSDRYNLSQDIVGKNVLVIPGHGNNGFLFAEAGAKSVTVYDKDPVTIAWMKAFKKYYHYKEYNKKGNAFPSVGELLTALTRWYPPLLSLPRGKYSDALLWLLNPKMLRRRYTYYLLSLVRQASQAKDNKSYELNRLIDFHVGELNNGPREKEFDTAFIPYLLGVKNGIEKEEEILQFIQQLTTLVPYGPILVSPSRSTKEFHFTGQSYFVTTGYPNIQSIPKIKRFFKGEDPYWLKTQGLAIFTRRKPEVSPFTSEKQ